MVLIHTFSASYDPGDVDITHKTCRALRSPDSPSSSLAVNKIASLRLAQIDRKVSLALLGNVI